MKEPNTLPAWQALERIRARDLRVEDYLASVFEQIERREEEVHAYTSIDKERAVTRARKLDDRLKKGKKVGRLCGVPIAVKDNICTADTPTTCSSKMLENFVPGYDATVVRRLLEEDAIIIGKTNMDEFAMGSTTEFSRLGPTRNPRDLSRVPGGSSGGSAAVIAAGEAAMALGSDTGGSIRCPAAFCGVVGLKPTYGLVSRFGLIAYANSLEQIGPIAKDVKDCALLLSCIAGHDSFDSTSVRKPPQDYAEALSDGLKGFDVGVPREFLGPGTQREVSRRVWGALTKMAEEGAVCEEISLKSLEYALPAYYVIAMSEASSNLARYDGVRYGHRGRDDSVDWNAFFAGNRREGFGFEVKRRIILGTFALSAGYYEQYYVKAQRVRTLVRREFEEAFKKYDFIVGPTMPFTPPKLGEKVEDPLEMYMCDIDTVPANLAGAPAITLPCGLEQGLPVGLQIHGPPLSEAELLRFAHSVERLLSGRA